MIELKNVTKKYGNIKAVDGISFKINKGEIVGFLGQNGAGKTTTMKIITGLVDPTEGEVLINNEPIGKKNKVKIGYMPENTPLYKSLTVKEFINFMGEIKGIKRRERKEAVENLIKRLNLEGVKNKIISNLSKGYKQRVSMAGALIGNPEIIVLDEPTVGLDPKQIIEIRSFIKSMGGNQTVFLSSHILTEINQICDRVIIIDKGKIIATDTPENLENKISQNLIEIIIEDPYNNIMKIKEKISGIKDIVFVSNRDKNEKEYRIKTESNTDIRKNLTSAFSALNISLIELRKVRSSLEEVFVNLLNEEDKK